MDWPQPIMIFLVDGELFGCPLRDIHKVLHAPGLSIYPVQINLPSLYGYWFHEDSCIPLVDFRVLFRKITIEHTLETSILITRLKSLDVGLRCDTVSAVITPESDLVRLPEPLLMEARDFFKGVFLHEGEIILLIDTEHLFLPGDLDLMEETGNKVRHNLDERQQTYNPS